MKWIPIKFRPMTEEEQESMPEADTVMIFDCPLPDDGEDVLVTTKYDGVRLDTFERDGNLCYFENCDTDEVRAWMRLPEPYEEVKA